MRIQCDEVLARRSGVLATALTAVFAATLAGCASAPGAATTVGPRAQIADSTANWPGVYLGTLPCADCNGIETALLLRRDASFQLATKRLGLTDAEGELRVVHGRASFNRARTEITLDSVRTVPNRYVIGDGQLAPLDSTGQPVTGELAARAVLRKQVTAAKP